MIEVKDLSFSYGSQEVLKNISLSLKEGNIYGLLGENGVGKTTLLTLLCGLKKPQGGTIETDGRKPYSRQPSLLQEQFYLPEEVSPVHERADAFGKEAGALWPNFDLEKYLYILSEFEVESKKRMDQMSAGQLKKTWIAFALACGVRHYFMDEPTNGLDIPSKMQFRKAIMKYTSEESTVVISTHQVRDLEELIDPIIILDKKSVLVNASLERIGSLLYFDYGKEVHPKALYTEQTPSGMVQVYPNADGRESKVNLEALFNAVHMNKEAVKSLFD
ncbi:MAG: ABC transporter ATP-binding protein [Bacteroidales bacterium]|nr:ABC transporter ATP-binding protein [Bacteroidales bacterium]